MDNQKQGLLGAMFGNMEYMVENRDKMQRMSEEYNVLRNALGRAPSEQELGFFLNNRMIYIDPNSVVRPEELGLNPNLDPNSVVRPRELGLDPSSTVRSGERLRAMYPDVNERALELRDQMRSLGQRAARPQDYTGAQGMDAMSRSAGGIEGLMRYTQMMRNMMPRGVR